MRGTRFIVILGALVLLLVGALIFMVGRSGTQQRTGTTAARQAQAEVPAAPATAGGAPPPTEAQAPGPSGKSGEESGTTPGAAAVIPAAFLGEWNVSLEDCGTSLDLGRMKVEPGRVLFHESEAMAKRVTIHDPRSITIEGPFQGEGESWDGRLRMDLSASGQSLTTGDLTRRRCPS